MVGKAEQSAGSSYVTPLSHCSLCNMSKSSGGRVVFLGFFLKVESSQGPVQEREMNKAEMGLLTSPQLPMELILGVCDLILAPGYPGQQQLVSPKVRLDPLGHYKE